MNASQESQITEDKKWQLRSLLSELSQLMASLSASLEQATWRGDDAMCMTLLQQLRKVLIEALQTGKELTGGPQ